MKTFLSILAIVITTITTAQSVIRGPYLQSNTHQSIIVMWRTSSESSTKVWYGSDPNNLSLTKEIQEHVKDHTLKIEGLLPHTKYYYAVGSSNGIIAGGTLSHTFTTHPIPGTPTPTRVWAIGDFGRGNQGQVDVKTSYLNYTAERGTDVWLWLGDNAYQDGSDAEYQSKVFDVNGFSDVFSHIPFYPCPGNHDYNSVWSRSTTLGIPYTNIPFADHKGPYFDIIEVPKYAEAGGYPSQHEVFYSFDYGDVHFLSLNSEVFDYTLTYQGINQMKAWIENDLRQNTRKFTVAYFHQCPYSKGSHDSDAAYELVIKAMREKIVPLLEQYDVDLVINGHSHVFERSYFMKGHHGKSNTFDAATMIMDPSNGKFSEGNAYVKDNSYATSEGTVYIVCGNSGSSENGPSLNHPAMIYSDGGSAAYGSLVLDIYRNRLDAKYLKSNGEIGDEFTIVKKDLVVQPQQNITICQGEGIDLSAIYSGGSDSLEILWIGSAETGANIRLSPTATTQYTLSVKDLYTQQTENSVFTITVVSSPVPVITEPITGTLDAGISGQGYSYQWNINNNPIAGANNQYYQPSFNGAYSVTVTNSAGCSSTSEAFVYGVNDIKELAGEDKTYLFPNPAEKEINLITSEKYISATFRIYDPQGKLLYTGKIKSISTKIDLSTYPSGQYILKIESSSQPQQYFISKK